MEDEYFKYIRSEFFRNFMRQGFDTNWLLSNSNSSHAGRLSGGNKRPVKYNTRGFCEKEDWRREKGTKRETERVRSVESGRKKEQNVERKSRKRSNDDIHGLKMICSRDDPTVFFSAPSAFVEFTELMRLTLRTQTASVVAVHSWTVASCPAGPVTEFRESIFSSSFIFARYFIL